MSSDMCVGHCEHWIEGDEVCCVCGVRNAPWTSDCVHVGTAKTADGIGVTARKSILDRAQEIVDGPRRASYGHPLPNHRAIANLWQAYLDNKNAFYPGEPLTPQDAATMMVLLKIARMQFEPGHEDSLLDSVGYLACIDIMNNT